MPAVVGNIELHMGPREVGGKDDLKAAIIGFIDRAKKKLFIAVQELDDPTIHELLPAVAKPVVTYGIDSKADWRAEEIQHEGVRSHFRAIYRGSETALPVTLNLPGRHNVLNALAAIAVAHELGVNEKSICDGLASFQGIGRRFQCFGQLSTPSGPGRCLPHSQCVTAMFASWCRCWYRSGCTRPCCFPSVSCPRVGESCDISTP